MTTHITVKIPEHVKQDLDFLSKITGMNVSELIRKIVVPLSKITSSLKAIETLEEAEKIVTRLIIAMPEFQELLRKLEKHVEVVGIYSGFSGERYHEIPSLFGDLTYNMVKDDKYYPVRLIENEVCNMYGTCWRDENTPFIERKIETLSELVDFLEYVSDKLHEKLEDNIERIKGALKRLLNQQ